MTKASRLRGLLSFCQLLAANFLLQASCYRPCLQLSQQQQLALHLGTRTSQSVDVSTISDISSCSIASIPEQDVFARRLGSIGEFANLLTQQVVHTQCQSRIDGGAETNFGAVVESVGRILSQCRMVDQAELCYGGDRLRPACTDFVEHDERR